MNVLFWGLGGVGQRHLRNFDLITKGQHKYYTIGEYKFKPYINDELQLDSSKNIYEMYHFDFIKHSDFIPNHFVDISFISTPSAFHYEHAKLLLQLGSHIYLEKPAALRCDHLRDLIQLKNHFNLKVSVVSQFRYNPLIMKLKSFLKAELYGSPLFVEAVVSEYMPNWHLFEDYRNSYASKSCLGGGVIFTQIHEIDYLYYLFGNLIVLKSVVGKFSNLEIDVEDTCLALLSTSSHTHNFPIYLRQDYLGYPPKRCLSVQFSSALVVCDFINLTITVSQPNIVPSLEHFSHIKRNDLFVQQLSDYLLSLESEYNSMVSLEEALDVVTIASNLKSYA